MSEKNNLKQVLREIDVLKLDKHVTNIGFVPETEIRSLYSNARALVMPSFFGPTNIPILEAWALRCPVVTSDLRGIREQVGDAALLVNPLDAQQIAGAIERLWTNDRLCADLIRHGADRLSRYGPQQFASQLLEILTRLANEIKNQEPRAQPHFN